MFGRFAKPVRKALVISILVLLVSPVVYSNEAVSVGTQARHYLSTFVAIILPIGGGQAEIPSKFGEPLTLLLMGAGYLVLERRVRRSGNAVRG